MQKDSFTGDLSKFARKYLCPGLFQIIKLLAYNQQIYLKNRLQQRCFHMNLEKFLIKIPLEDLRAASKSIKSM